MSLKSIIPGPWTIIFTLAFCMVMLITNYVFMLWPILAVLAVVIAIVRVILSGRSAAQLRDKVRER